MRGRQQLRALALGMILAMAGTAGTAGAQPVAVGQARQVVRSVYGTINSVRRAVAVDGDVYWQELIETGDESAAKMVFLDGTTLSTGPNSQVRIDEFVYSGGSTASRVVIDIGRGVMRFISGLSPSAAYTIRTPNAMIGIRGTDFTVFVDDRGGTRVFVKRGVVTFAGAGAEAGRNVIDIGAGQTSGIGGDGAPASEPGPPDSETIAAATEITALLAIAGDAAPAAASSTDDVAALGGRKSQAAAARAATAASATGADCTGC